MLDKVKRYGTSQDSEEFVVYSNSSTYRGFACLIARTPKKGFGYLYKGLGRELYPVVDGGHIINLETGYAKNKHDAGKLLYNYVDLVREKK